MEQQLPIGDGVIGEEEATMGLGKMEGAKGIMLDAFALLERMHPNRRG
jgi:hypothetical protein